MGEVKVKILLQNDGDIFAANAGYIKKEEIREITAEGLVDSGAVMLIIPQDIVEKLGLENIRKVVVSYADDRKEERPVAGRVRISICDRFMITECIVGPPLSEILIGQVILEELDLLVDCVNQKLTPRPESPYLPLLKAK